MTLALAIDRLRRPRTWPNGHVTAEYRAGLAPADLVANVRVVPFVESGWCVLTRTAEWGWMVPGGTREPGESPLETAVREMREEIGGVLLSYRPIGADWCVSTAAPYRPHLPHPEFCMVYGWGEVELTGPPAPCAGGETVVEVGVFRVDEAIEALLAQGEPEGAAIVRLAAGDKAAFRGVEAL